MNPRERPGKRGLVFPPSWHGERYTPAEEEAMERLQEAEGERAPADLYPCRRNNALYAAPCDGCYCTPGEDAA